jgi:N-acetylglucosaminyldiphosphoundecaprenol N-acetyl-beta-D-mannosaminyltransferase
MDTTIKIMDLDINIISIDSFIVRIKNYFTNDALNVILLSSTEMLEEATENSGYRDMISRADMILPGDKTILSMHHGDDLEMGGMIVDCQCFDYILENIQKENETIYILSGSQDEVEKITAYCKSKNINAQITGNIPQKYGQNDELIINAINGFAPGVLILTFGTPFQEKWIMENRRRLNTKVCICVGGFVDKILAKQGQVPTIVKGLGLEKFYNRKKGFNLKNIRKIRIFKKKVANYKNKKGE